ncbi:MAG: cellobiose phosphorylase [Acetatifactor sp.]|nr:cellobiose phosphorylase [Acetatifactor sp.]
MSNYKLSGEKFIIEEYTKVPPFSSFLPGLAGVKGIPVLSFYTNRGQAINSFGIHNKGNAMMEFNPANTAYEETPVKGFRTFIRVDGKFYEPFCAYAPEINRKMEIEKNIITISEESNGLKMTVEYIVLPNENIGALVRKVTIQNTDSCAHALEVLDGMAQIIPFGVQNSLYKEMSNLFRSYSDIKNEENNAPFFATRSSGDDSSEVVEIEGGFFYLAVKDGKLQPVICDKLVVFDYDHSMVTPVVFKEEGMVGVLNRTQHCVNKVPCGFIPVTQTLQAGESLTFTAFAGFAPSIALLNQKAAVFCQEGYTDKKIAEARKLVALFTKDVWTQSANPLFDQYMEQCYLDNFLRGGYPFIIGSGEKKAVVHLFSRKHGDPERDYNFFSIAGEYYSQGNGNYRDVCQNRRNDVFFNPAIGDFNVHHFYSLVQMDGYNPLEIRPCTFVIPAEKMDEALKVVSAHVEDEGGKVAAVLAKPYTPGQITNVIAKYQMKVTGDEEVMVNDLIALSEERIEANFAEGYWSDHWDYNLDLVDNYLAIYPDKQEELLFGDSTYRFYNSIGVVRPRRDTYVLNREGAVRQYGAVYHSDEKANMPGFVVGGTNWLKDQCGKVVTTTLFGKMMTLAVNKFALLDSYGMGIEMDGGKPGWNDAMNGLPGLFGSSMPETMELKRLVQFMVKVLPAEGSLKLPAELVGFMRGIYNALGEELSAFAYWDEVANLREAFREEILLDVSGEQTDVSFAELKQVLDAFNEKLQKACDLALEVGGGIMPTYFTYEADEYVEVMDGIDKPRISPYGMPSVEVKSFKLVNVPYFLEGPAKMLAACEEKDRDVAKAMYEKIKGTDIYDKKLKMYKTSESIDAMSIENGRVRAFTAGWLERESIFLHMEYKYFLGLLKAGLYEEFFESIGDALIPYQKPEVYGRSILENSSFLASSANPDPTVHGQGFVARLSGSTVEMLSMWIGMFVGNGGFKMQDGKLSYRFAPILPASMFDAEGNCSFMLCGNCKVTYHNAAGKNTYGTDGAKAVKIDFCSGSKCASIVGDSLDEEAALMVREGKAQSIDVYFE